VGRLPVITTLEELGAEDLVRVLTEPRNALVKQYQAIFRMEDCELLVEEDALREIARIALRRETGVRALRTIFEDLLRDALFDLPSRAEKGRYLISSDYVANHRGREMEFHAQAPKTDEQASADSENDAGESAKGDENGGSGEAA
jgi:ATP-dependent Clp protease ATP-binding subunit ClpX